MKKILLVILFLFSASIFAAMPIFTQTYDILPEDCEGLYLDGVSYAFTIGGAPSGACSAGTFIGPGVTNNIEAPNIEGPSAGVLHLTFDVPTTKFGFGVGQSTNIGPQTVIINLYRPGVGLLREQVLLDITIDPAFVGGRYDYKGPAVKTVTIQFNNTFTLFVLDNVSYFRPPGQTDCTNQP